MASSDLDSTGIVTDETGELTELELHNARLVVCGFATDVEEARELLGMLGLVQA